MPTWRVRSVRRKRSAARGLWPVSGSPICLPVSASHNRAVLSADPVMMRLPSRRNAALQTSSSWATRPARTRHRAICDDRHHANLVRTAPLLRANMIVGQDRSGRPAGLFLTTRRLVTSARTMAQPFVRRAPGSPCFAGFWICLSTRRGRERRDSAYRCRRRRSRPRTQTGG